MSSAAKKRDHSIAAALALAPSRETDLSGTSGPRHKVTGRRVLCDKCNDLLSLFIGDAFLLGGRQKSGRFYDRLHDRDIRNFRSLRNNKVRNFRTYCS